MAKQKQGRQRPFRPEALRQYAAAELRPRMGPGEVLWRYTVTIPLEEIVPLKRQKATAEDLNNLRKLFVEHFGGCTPLPNSPGYGLRNPADPQRAPEMNYNAYFAVLSSPIPEAEAFFRALREELEAALDEGVILVERQDIWIP
jgi:hypothetical protein